MAKAGVIIRPISNADVSDVVRLWNCTLSRDIISEPRFVQWLFVNPDFDPLKNEGCWVAEKNGAVVGFARAVVRLVPNDGLGLEEEGGWIPVFFVAPKEQHKGIGSQLMKTMIDYFKAKKRKRIFFCGNTGSAPGYVFPGIDKDAYPSGHAFLKKSGFVVDHEPVAMSRPIIDIPYDKYYAEAWAEGTTEGVCIQTLTHDMIFPYLQFMRKWFPGDWNIAARNQIKSGKIGDMLIALFNGEIIGYCQWDGEHFGPFGVREGLRGKRIGAKLFLEAMRRIKVADGRTVWFNWADPDAARFYQRFGFQIMRNFAIMRLDLQ